MQAWQNTDINQQTMRPMTGPFKSEQWSLKSSSPPLVCSDERERERHKAFSCPASIPMRQWAMAARAEVIIRLEGDQGLLDKCHFLKGDKCSPTHTLMPGATGTWKHVGVCVYGCVCWGGVSVCREDILTFVCHSACCIKNSPEIKIYHHCNQGIC